MSEDLVTRDGKVVKGLGSWEREQLKKNPLKPVETNARRYNVQGRRRQTVEDNPMLYITEPKVGGRFVVSVKHLGLHNKNFTFKEYGGREEALKEASKYRDLMLLERDKKEEI